MPKGVGEFVELVVPAKKAGLPPSTKVDLSFQVVPQVSANITRIRDGERQPGIYRKAPSEEKGKQ